MSNTSPDAVSDRQPLSFFDRHPDLYWCPACHGDIARAAGAVACAACRREYPVTGGIPQFFVSNEWDGSKDDVTDRMRAFYEANPFPDYDAYDSAGTLLDKARRGRFARLLDDQVPYGARVLECGCGTGQLTNFLAIATRTVIGTDMCMNSLGLAERFRKSNDLQRAHFHQMNLFRPCFRPGSFDLVISNGVLHHTSDPELGFRTISQLVRPGGYVLVGLYHRYGRLATNLRRSIFNATDSRFLFLDRHASDPKVSPAKRRAWFMDQYRNPHESTHTVGGVLEWLKRAGLEFVSSVPRTVPFSPLAESDRLFRRQPLGNALQRAAVNAGLMLTGHREGGFFIVIAQRPASQAS